ncbi:hypothetical protein CRG98_047081 [Punica granatum]|uniref:Uncharacterized protein n=1 Tax=Punica granatum TaxID=22663 RepID=A0A2I0HLC6_PUNGR|nr:hypothetical protein CRG98_047081 [Punica granatum]
MDPTLVFIPFLVLVFHLHLSVHMEPLSFNGCLPPFSKLKAAAAASSASCSLHFPSLSTSSPICSFPSWLRELLLGSPLLMTLFQVLPDEGWDRRLLGLFIDDDDPQVPEEVVSSLSSPRPSAMHSRPRWSVNFRVCLPALCGRGSGVPPLALPTATSPGFLVGSSRRSCPCISQPVPLSRVGYRHEIRAADPARMGIEVPHPQARVELNLEAPVLPAIALAEGQQLHEVVVGFKIGVPCEYYGLYGHESDYCSVIDEALRSMGSKSSGNWCRIRYHPRDYYLYIDANDGSAHLKRWRRHPPVSSARDLYWHINYPNRTCAYIRMGSTFYRSPLRSPPDLTICAVTSDSSLSVHDISGGPLPRYSHGSVCPAHTKPYSCSPPHCRFTLATVLPGTLLSLPQPLPHRPLRKYYPNGPYPSWSTTTIPKSIYSHAVLFRPFTPCGHGDSR